MTVPVEYVTWRLQMSAGTERGWLDGLPGDVAELCRGWGLTLVRTEARTGGTSLVLFATREGVPVVVRLSPPHHGLHAEVAALRAWNGGAAVRLLAHDPARSAVLIEQLDPTTSLADVVLAEAAEIVGELILALSVPAPAGVRPLDELADDLRTGLAERNATLGSPLSSRSLDRTLDLLDSVLPVAGSTLVHGDLHYGNVLRDLDHTRWAAIDPRPISGDPEFSVPELMWSRIDECDSTAAIQSHLRTLCRAAALDQECAQAWTVVRAVDYQLWGMARGLTIDPPRCARLVEALS